MAEFLPTGAILRADTEFGEAPVSPLPYCLSELQEEYRFFNHGVLLQHAGFTEEHDPVNEWYLTRDQPPELYREMYSVAVLDGLTLPLDGLTWGHTVCAVRKDRWPSLLQHLGGICVYDKNTNTIGQVFWADLSIADPGYVVRCQRSRGAPLINLAVFCYETWQQRYEFFRVGDDWTRPKLYTRPGRPELRELNKFLRLDDISWAKHRLNPAHKDFFDKYQEALTKGPVCDHGSLAELRRSGCNVFKSRDG